MNPPCCTGQLKVPMTAATTSTGCCCPGSPAPRQTGTACWCGRALPLLAIHPVAHISERLHCSQRTLERSFARVTGLTLKQCQSINHLEAILEFLHQQGGAHIDWSDIAQRFGFSDQPHLIRHLKDSIGITPGEYARQRDLTIDVYGNFSQPSD